MAIEEVRKKIHFTPFDIKKGRAVDDGPSPTMTLTKGALRFNKSLIMELQLDGKFVKFVSDPLKNVIGFKIGKTIDQRELKTWKRVKQNKTSGSWTVSIKKMLLAQFSAKTAKGHYPMMPVKKYIESSDVMERGDIYYFVEIVEEVKKSAPPREEKSEPSEPVTEADLEKALEEITKA